MYPVLANTVILSWPDPILKRPEVQILQNHRTMNWDEAWRYEGMNNMMEVENVKFE